MPIHFKRFGEGPPLLLLHGLFGSLENLGVLSRDLSQHFSVYALDLPNHGQSEHSASTSIPELCGQVKAWLDTQGLHEIVAVGHSLGGKIAMELALTYPSLVKQLVVLDIAPVKYASHHNKIFQGLLSIEPEALQTRGDADKQLSEYVGEAAVRSFLLKNLEKREGAYRWKMNLPILHRDYGQLIESNCEGEWPGQALFVRGGSSDYILEEHLPEIRSRFPQAKVETVAETGHWLHAEKPQEVLGFIKLFLSEA